MQVIGHRGASSYAPENTIPSFDLAIEMGADGLETDIRASRDGCLVLLHDAMVDRTTDGHGPIADLTWKQVSQLDAGRWFDPRFAGTRILTLDAFLDRYGGRLTLNLEIKAPNIEAGVIDAVRTRDLAGSAVITSFSWETCVICHRLMPELPVSFLARQFDEAIIRQVKEAGLAQICPRATDLKPELVSMAHADGLVVRAWGVPDEAVMAQAVAAGVDGMTVNFPDKLLAYLRAKGLR